MNAFYEQMHTHTKVAQFSICHVHFTAALCPLSLLVLAALNLWVGACRVLPKGGRGLGFAPIRGLGMGLGKWLGCGFGRGLHWGIHLHGGGLRGSFELGLRGLLSLRLRFRLSWLGGRLSRRVSVRFGVRLLYGLGGLLTCSCSLLLLPMGHYYSMRGIKQMPPTRNISFSPGCSIHTLPPAPPTTEVTTPG